MFISTVTLSSKGQIVLPKAVRDIFDTKVVSLEMQDNGKLVISPVHNARGSLSAYKKNCTLPFEEGRELAWKKSVAERYGKTGK